MTSDLWNLVHGVVSDSRRHMDRADRALWGIFGIPSDSPERQRRIAEAETEAHLVYETLRDYFDAKGQI